MAAINLEKRQQKKELFLEYLKQEITMGLRFKQDNRLILNSLTNEENDKTNFTAQVIFHTNQ